MTEEATDLAALFLLLEQQDGKLESNGNTNLYTFPFKTGRVVVAFTDEALDWFTVEDAEGVQIAAGDTFGALVMLVLAE